MTDPVTVQVPLDLLRVLLVRASECADDMEATISATYPSRHEQPVQQRRYDRDMSLVHDTRDIVMRVRQTNKGLQ